MQKLKVGTMLYRMRMQREVTRKQLCSGLCQISTMSYYENNDRVPDSLLFYYFMQRLGMTPEDYAIMLSKKEYDYYRWKDKTICALRESQWDRLEQLIEEKEALQIKCNERIQRQYYYFLKGILELEKEKRIDKAVEYLRTAAEQTMSGIEELENGRILLGTAELQILILYLYIGTRERFLKKEDAESLFFKLEKYIRDGLLEPNEQVKIYIKLVCMWINLMGRNFSAKQKLTWCKYGVGLLKETKTFYDVVEVLRLYLENLRETGEDGGDIIEKQYWAIKEILEQGGCDISFRPTVIGGRNPKLYMIHEYLYSQRMIKQMTQENVSEGICEPESYSRIERGKRIPNVKKI